MYCQGLASQMQTHNEENMGDIIYSRYVQDEFNKELIKRNFECICDPTNAQIMVRAKSLETETD